MKAKNNLIVAGLFLNVILLVLVGARQAFQSTSFDKLTVREFELIDEKGVPRLFIKVEPEGELVFRMLDEKGTIRVKMGASEEGSGLVLLNADTEPGFHALSKDGTTLTLMNADGSKRSF